MLTINAVTLMLLITLCPVTLLRGVVTNNDALLTGASGTRTWRFDGMKGDSKGNDNDKEDWMFKLTPQTCVKTEARTRSSRTVDWHFGKAPNLLTVEGQEYLFEYSGYVQGRYRMTLTEIKGGRVDDNSIYLFSSSER